MIGSRIAARFAQIGLDTDIPEWRGQASNGKPAILEIAERLASASDEDEQQRLKEELARMIFGNSER